MTTLAIVGSTGSIGRQTIEVATAGGFEVVALGANSSVDLLCEQVAAVHPQVVAIADASKATELQQRLPVGVELRAGEGALASLTTDAEVVVNAVVGFAGLPVTLKTLEDGKRLALANKESLVAGGRLVDAVRATPGAELLPIDSEHAALHQCLDGRNAVKSLVVTASGGPFIGKSADELASVTVKEALDHPTWKMGPKITVDSSTLFNKGLEVIEANELFGIPYEAIEVVVHPQSIVHSAVTFTDGSTIAQMSNPDMRLPIGYAIGYPTRLETAYGALDWARVGPLTFQEPDRATFACLDLAYAAGRRGGTAPAWLNAANEVAVDAFLKERVSWSSISSIIEETLAAHDGEPPSSVEAVVEADRKARVTASLIVDRYIREA